MAALMDRSLAWATPVAARALLMTVLTAALLLVAPRPAHATAPADVIDAGSLQDFFDTAVPQGLERHQVPGATVAVVRDGRVVFSAGYGMADIERGAAFDADTSTVRIASISKLFTWTAVMQLVEDGLLDLGRDVNAYLDAFQIPDTFPEPITLDDLMAHTAGFEERGIGIAARDKADVPPLGEYLAAHLPARVRPPGVIPAYSNHGAALAGHIVAEVAGMPYEQYIDDHILQPLDMRHATAWEPVPEHLAGAQARSYEHTGGAYEPVPFVYDILVPDGSVSASAVDMAHFMIAHLQDGRFEDTRILAAPTARLMHAQSFTATPAVSGWAHGFKERTFNGRRVLMHDGSWEAFQSGLLLVPEEDLGVFISYNAIGGIAAMTELIPAFFDRFLPPEPAPAAAAATPGPVPLDERIEGRYRSTRSASTTIEKVLTLVDSSGAGVTGDGTLRFGGREWSAIAPSVYQEVDGTDRLAAVPSDDGSTVYLATDTAAYEKLAWHETIRFNLVVLAVFLVSAVTVLVGRPVAVLAGRRRARPGAPLSRPWRTARRLTTAASAAGAFFVVMFAITLLGDTSEFLYGAPLRFRALMLVPVLFIGLVAATIVMTVRAQRAEPAGLLTRVHQVTAVVGMLALVWFLQQWNMIGWRFG